MKKVKAQIAAARKRLVKNIEQELMRCPTCGHKIIVALHGKRWR